MSTESAIVARLKSDEGVTIWVDDRIYPIFIPESATLPCITYQTISRPEQQSHDGPVHLVNSRIQITSFADHFDDALSVAAAVRESLNGFAGIFENITIQYINVDGGGDVPSVSPDNDQLRRFGRRIDFEVWSEE